MIAPPVVRHGISYSTGRQFCVVAKKHGRGKEWRLMMHTFATGSDAEEMMDRVRARVLSDAAFREKWLGWRFMPLEYTTCLDVMTDGVTEFRVNDKLVVTP